MDLTWGNNRFDAGIELVDGIGLPYIRRSCIPGPFLAMVRASTSPDSTGSAGSQASGATPEASRQAKLT